VNWLSQGTVDTPPTSIYVAVFDQSGTERSSDFLNGRVEVPAGSGWDVTDTAFQNAAEVSFGEASVDVNDIEDVALYDAATGGNELARYPHDDAPFDVADGTTHLFQAGDLQFDVIDRTE
jgi:hypothetical protein